MRLQYNNVCSARVKCWYQNLLFGGMDDGCSWFILECGIVGFLHFQKCVGVLSNLSQQFSKFLLLLIKRFDGDHVKIWVPLSIYTLQCTNVQVFCSNKCNIFSNLFIMILMHIHL